MGHRRKGHSYILHAASGIQPWTLSQEEEDMHRAYQYLFTSFVLTAALAAPSAMNAAGKAQDNGRQEENHRDDKDRNRVYDRYHKDYHNWDDREDHAYRGYLEERHREYRPLTEMRAKQQRAYWNWRHNHPDHDNGR
jgi:Ni/Co efflux regulator RcnB